MMSDLGWDHSPLKQRSMNPSNTKDNDNNNKDCYSRLDVDSWKNNVKEKSKSLSELKESQKKVLYQLCFTQSVHRSSGMSGSVF